MRFSQRKGLTPVVNVVQVDDISEPLRNSLWNLLHLRIWQESGFLNPIGPRRAQIYSFSSRLWGQYFKLPIDARPDSVGGILKYIRAHFFAVPWHGVYDFLEWTVRDRGEQRLIDEINTILSKELAGYRFVGDGFVEITSEEEVRALQDALADDRFAGVRTHLASALKLLSDRKNPDYRNSIKESISAVESMARVVTGNPKATLGEALSKLEKDKKLHPALKAGFSSLYGYTSNEGGIRHAMLEIPEVAPADAKYFLVSCTAFVNYLKSKI